MRVLNTISYIYGSRYVINEEVEEERERTSEVLEVT
jgi:hypothetical protein